MILEPLAPTPQEVLKRLAMKYGFPQHGNPTNVFFCAVYVLLSAQTTLEQASSALVTLRRIWPTPAALSHARVVAVRQVIRACGFGRQRAPKIVALAKAVANDAGRFKALSTCSDDELETYLTALPGIGFKTARVVAAMSELARDRFAIDIHTWRVAARLGWIDDARLDRKPSLRQANALEAVIPSRTRRQLHSCLVALGRDCCGSARPSCDNCVLRDLCPHGNGVARPTPSPRGVATPGEAVVMAVNATGTRKRIAKVTHKKRSARLGNRHGRQASAK